MSESTTNTETTKLDETELNNVAGGVGAVDAGQKKRANGHRQEFGPGNVTNQSNGLHGEFAPIPNNRG